MTITVYLPWPPRSLSPNGRYHWSVTAKAKKLAFGQAWALTLEALKGQKVEWDKVSLHWVFHPKTRNEVDDDNAESSCKAYRDGIAKALGIDDKKFKATKEMAEPVKGGKVIVTIMEGEK